MADDAEYRANRAMALKPPPAPVTLVTSKVDLAHDPFPYDGRRVCLHYLAHELVTRRAAKPVVAALEFEIRIADAGHEEADPRVAGGTAWRGAGAHFDTALIEMDREHAVMNQDT
jgi:hypothetical protein